MKRTDCLDLGVAVVRGLVFLGLLAGADGAAAEDSPKNAPVRLPVAEVVEHIDGPDEIAAVLSYSYITRHAWSEEETRAMLPVLEKHLRPRWFHRDAPVAMSGEVGSRIVSAC